MTISEFEYARSDESADELSRGMVVREPGPGARHGIVAARLFATMLGAGGTDERGVLLFNTGFVLREEPATVRIPDVAWIARTRVPESVPTSFWRLAPDLAVEVVSPGNRTSDMLRRVLDYLGAGTRQFWMVDPESRSVMVLRSRADIRLLGEEDDLEGADLMPGLSVPLRDLFA